MLNYTVQTRPAAAQQRVTEGAQTMNRPAYSEKRLVFIKNYYKKYVSIYF